MSHSSALPPPPPPMTPALSPERALHKLFLTLFLRGRSSRGLKKEGAPQSVGSKLTLSLCIYGLFGLSALAFLKQPVFALSLYLHAMTLALLGMFVAASSGEVLFNKEEADILLHRPVTPRALLRAKVGVLVRVSLWMAGAFNLAGLFVGIGAGDGGWLFPLAHILSTALEALFCTGSVVLIYQLCLRWFGRERLDGLMTTAQVFVAMVAILGGQVPQLLRGYGGKLGLNVHSWWIALLPPAWFAGFDDLIAGSHAAGSAALAVAAIGATTLVLWMAFGKLAQDYETGLQNLGETSSPKRPRGARRRWLDVLTSLPPMRWWLRDSVARASFLLVGAYLFRDRDVKLRLYPGIAPMMVWPLFLLIQDGRVGHGGSSGFGIAFAGMYLGLVPLLALNILRYSQQWQAADLFRVAPMAGPARLCHGARQAVMCFLALPMLVAVALLAWLFGGGGAHLPLLLPGVIALPVYALIPCLGGEAVPLSLPTEEAKAAKRNAAMIGVMVVSAALSGLALWAWSGGWFRWFLVGETAVVIGVYMAMSARIKSTRWDSIE